MTSRTAALRYARALFDVSLAEHVDLEDVSAKIAAFAGLFRQHPTLGKVLLNPAVPAPRKRAAVAELLRLAPVPTPVAKLLLLLAERDRLAILPDLVDAYSQRLLDHQNVVRAQVTTVAPLAADKAVAIEASLGRATGRRVTLSNHVDPSLIGGLVARIGSTVFDGSITGQLSRMRQKLEQA